MRSADGPAASILESPMLFKFSILGGNLLPIAGAVFPSFVMVPVPKIAFESTTVGILQLGDGSVVCPQSPGADLPLTDPR
jgi:hypothetical protein